jgi:hypothetical protein
MNTSNVAKLEKPVEKAIALLNDKTLTRCDCNKAIMIITDGSADNFEDISSIYNQQAGIRIFSFKIGRDMSDPSEIIKLACENNGEYYHVVTLTDINEHVYDYISVLSRPMALRKDRETRWSNVFIGSLDHELKIAVARPAFKDVSALMDRFNLKLQINATKSNLTYYSAMFVNATDEQFEFLQKSTAFIAEKETLLEPEESEEKIPPAINILRKSDQQVIKILNFTYFI